MPILPPLFSLATLPASLTGWLSLLGRMHVIVIHFPIALLLMAALGELTARFRRAPSPWTTASLVIGTLGAINSALFGWLLVIYNENPQSSTLTLHQWLGTTTAALAVAALLLHWPLRNRHPRWYTTTLILLTAALVGLTGHLGGTLVHGDIFSPQ